MNNRTQSAPMHPPTEILQDIFQRVCSSASCADVVGSTATNPDDLARCCNDSLDLDNPIWVLSQVCRHWRRAAFSPSAGPTINSLWSTIVLGDNFTTLLREDRVSNDANDDEAARSTLLRRRRLDGALYRLARQLDRSNDHPLDIRILLRGGTTTAPIRLDALAPFVALLASHRARWQSVAVQDSRSKVPIDFWRSVHSMVLPMISREEVDRQSPLESASSSSTEGLDLHLQRSTHVDEIDHLKSGSLPAHLDPLGPLTNLRSFRTSGVLPPRAFVPWAQLENLDISRCSANDVVAILPSLTSIRTLRVGSLKNDPRSFIRTRLTSCTLPNLIQLDVRDAGLSDEIIRQLTAPSLTTIYVPRLDTFFTPPPLLSLIERSHCSIMSLETYTIQSPPEQEPFLSLLSAMPSLHELKVGTGPMPEGLVDFTNPSPIITMNLNMIKMWLRVFLHHVLVDVLARHTLPPPFSHYDTPSELAVVPELNHISLRIPQMATDPFDVEPLLAMLEDRSERGALRAVDIDFMTASEPLSEEQIRRLNVMGEAGLRVGAKWKDADLGGAGAVAAL